MKQMPSAQFRTQYARLSEPTVVTVLGRPIGTWTPHRWGLYDADQLALQRNYVDDAEARRARQATIDATLGKVNRKAKGAP